MYAFTNIRYDIKTSKEKLPTAFPMPTMNWPPRHKSATSKSADTQLSRNTSAGIRLRLRGKRITTEAAKIDQKAQK